MFLCILENTVKLEKRNSNQALNVIDYTIQPKFLYAVTFPNFFNSSKFATNNSILFYSSTLESPVTNHGLLKSIKQNMQNVG